MPVFLSQSGPNRVLARASFMDFRFFPRRERLQVAAFVEFDLVDEGFDRVAGQAGVFDALRKNVAAFVAPAALGDEAVPDVALFVVARELTRGVQADLIQHSPKINQAADFIVATAQAWNVWHEKNNNEP